MSDDDAVRVVHDASAVHAVVSAATIDVAALEAWVSTAADGAVVTFRGIVRNHDHGVAVSRLEYQAHPDAERLLNETCARLSAETGLRIAVVHRVGPLAIGDVALAAAVASPHRAEAFAALAKLVDEIKHDVPIWKRQHLADGLTEWVGLTD